MGATSLRHRTMPPALIDDLRHATRTLRLRPGFALTAILAIGLGIGCNTAIFGVIHGLLLRPLPYPEGHRLVQLYSTTPVEPETRSTVAEYLDRRAQADALEESALYYESGFDLATDAAPRRLQGVVATPSFFRVLGVAPGLGRTFGEDEAEPITDAGAMWVSGQPVAVLSDALWREQFGADPAVIGSEVRLNGRPHRVIGVMPAGFAFPRREVEIWLPFAFSARQRSDAMRSFGFAESIGRLKPGATSGQLDAQLDAVAGRNAARLRASGDADPPGADRSARSRPLHAQLTEDIAGALWLLQGGVALLLLIACANVATLLLIRYDSRRSELAVRAALGATPARVAAPLLAESLWLIALGGALGLLIAAAGLAAVRALGLDGGQHGFRVGLDLPVLAFAVATLCATGLAFATLPALGLRRVSAWHALHGARGPGVSRAQRRVRDGLVVAQLGLAVALVAGAGLLLHSFANVLREDPGFAISRLVGANVALSRDRYPDVAAVRDFKERLPGAVRALPGVEAVGLMSGMPFSVDFDSSAYFIDDASGGPSGDGYMQLVDDTLFETMEIPLLRGRAFGPGDDANAAPVAIIDATIAQRHFAGNDPIGRRIGTPAVDGIAWRTIVGVVGGTKRHALSRPDDATFYWPLPQSPMRNLRLAIRTGVPAASLAAPLRGAVASIDPQQTVYDVVAMDDRIESSLADRRAALGLTLALGGVALVLGAIGVYGTLAFAVAQRRGEIGVRMSLGATRAAILREVIGSALRLLAAGLAFGLALAFALGRVLQAQLFGVGPADPLTLLLVVATLALTTLAASWIPARHAAGVAPMSALRCE